MGFFMRRTGEPELAADLTERTPLPGSSPARCRRKGHCNHQPDGALQTMTSRDAFVTLQERAGGSSSGFPPRPASFERRARADDGSFADCLQGRPDLTTFWLPFSDEGHNLYALVVIGRDAPREVQTETFAILDRLRFEPR
jgi:hypothetical protein